MSDEELKVEEIRKLIVEGKVQLNKIIKAVVNTIVPVSIPAKKERGYRRVKESRGPKGRTMEEKREYGREYYKKNKDKFKERYQENRDVLNENGKKYYKLKKLQKLQEKFKNEDTRSVTEGTPLNAEPSELVKTN